MPTGHSQIRARSRCVLNHFCRLNTESVICHRPLVVSIANSTAWQVAQCQMNVFHFKEIYIATQLIPNPYIQFSKKNWLDNKHWLNSRPRGLCDYRWRSLRCHLDSPPIIMTGSLFLDKETPKKWFDILMRNKPINVAAWSKRRSW